MEVHHAEEHLQAGITLLQADNPIGALQRLLPIRTLETPVPSSEYCIGLCFAKLGNKDEAAKAFCNEIREFPDNHDARSVLEEFYPVPNGYRDGESPGEKTARKYALLYASPVSRHADYIYRPVFDWLQANSEIDLTMFSAKGRFGLEGEGFDLGPVRISRKPDVVVSFRPWWEDDFELCMAARKQGISVVMMNHGAMNVFNPSQVYKKSIYPADVGCLWGEHDLALWRRRNSRDEFVVTGNPSYDPASFVPIDIEGLPERFAVLLTSGQGFQSDILLASALELRKLMPVVVKPHPLCPHVEMLREKGLQIFEEPEHLLTLMYRSDLILSNLSSAYFPALYWEKPIFLHSYQSDGIEFDQFKSRFWETFNFKEGPEWTEDMIQNAKHPSKEDYKTFAHLPDGKNAERVAKVILSRMQ